MASQTLPPNWTRYLTDDGKEYFHNSVTNVTQWDRPMMPVAAPTHDLLSGLNIMDPISAPESSSAAEVYQYTPSATELEAPSSSAVGQSQAGDLFGLQVDTNVADIPAGMMSMAPSKESEMVSLTSQPAPTITGSSSTASGATASGGSSGGGFGGMGGMLTSMAVSAVAGRMGGDSNNASSESGASEGGMANFLLGYAQRLFDVTTDDVVQRLKLVLVPYPPMQNPNAAMEMKAKPDFYGPFWVATTAVLFLAMTGNFARLLQVESHNQFEADRGLIHVAASMVYGCLLAVPLIARVSLFVSGEEVASVDLKHMICVCGYALAPAIPVSILCIIPSAILRTLFVLAGLAMTLYFLRGNLLQEISVKAQWLKWTLVVGPCVAQALVFGIYRLHFFVPTKA